jgi:hypothetical protein
LDLLLPGFSAWTIQRHASGVKIEAMFAHDVVCIPKRNPIELCQQNSILSTNFVMAIHLTVFFFGLRVNIRKRVRGLFR